MRKLLAVLLGTLVSVGLIPSQSQAEAPKLPQDGKIILGHAPSTVGAATLKVDPDTVVVPAPDVGTDRDRIITFEVPGSASYGGTEPFTLNLFGAVAGIYAAADGIHGFVRAPDGAITTISAPGAVYTSPESNNLEGAITGYYFDDTDTSHGFLRRPDGTFTPPIDVTGAGEGNNLGTFAFGINAVGAIAGDYADTNGVSHGFLRDPEGTITTFDAPGACSSGVTCSGLGTFTTPVLGLNLEGAIAGAYNDTNGVIHSFVRDPRGAITTFDAPGACSSGVTCSGLGTTPSGINLEGAITGTYTDTNRVFHGFVRAPDGAITTFDAPGACSSGVTCSGLGTVSQGNNDLGAITGNYTDTNGVNHGYLRDLRGTITTFDAPGACSSGVTCSGLGTIPVTPNDLGEITGYDFDASGVVHGFLLIP